MNLYHPCHKICGKLYSRIQLLKLAGVHGIHPRLHRSDRIKLSISVLDKDSEDESVVLSISSVSIVRLQVVVYPNKKIIQNQLFVKQKQGEGSAFNWVNKQTQFTRGYAYQYLKCEAKRDDHYKIEINGVQPQSCPLIGYKIWMKFGYLMTTASKLIFQQFLRENGKANTLTIFDLIKTDEKLWDIKGDTWYGEFNLAEGSDSERILREYRPAVRN
jgi:hypothetical protein